MAPKMEFSINNPNFLFLCLLLPGLFCHVLSEKSPLAASQIPSAAAEHKQKLDVLEKENVLLECRIPKPSNKDSRQTVYWLRSNNGKSQNVAIMENSFETNYRLESELSRGKYDLRIFNATYDRDNGRFDCHVIEDSEKVYAKSVQLTVLMKPSAPTILPAGKPVQASEGQQLNLTCSSTGGSPAPQIYWYSDGQSQLLDALLIKGKTKDEPTVSILTINPTKESDGSSFRCSVWNRALDQTQKFETTTVLDVKYIPRITVGPENPLRVEKGSTAVLECSVDAKPSVGAVKWTRKGKYINIDFRHTIPVVSIDDAGAYTCSADNNLGKVGTGELQLDVLHAPIVTVSSRREVKAGEDVNVECKVVSNPKPRLIEWAKMGDPSFRQTGPVLRLLDIAAGDNGRYVCTATNEIHVTGKAAKIRSGNATVEINVRHAPGKAFIEPEEPKAVEGKSVTLKCNSEPKGYPAPRYRWWKQERSSEINTLAVTEEFTINDVKLDSAGKYFCQPINDLGAGSIASAMLRVYQAPQITTNLQPTVMKRAGDTGFRVTCSASGKPKPIVRWFKNGREIDEKMNGFYEISTIETETSGEGGLSNEIFGEGQGEASYNIISNLKFVGDERIGGNHLTSSDKGHYTCHFTNEVATSETTMLLRIEHSPEVIHRHNKVAYDLGEIGMIPCRMQAFPVPRFEWTFSNSLITSNGHYGVTNLTSIEDDIFQSTLILDSINEEDYGEYICKGINVIGQTRTVIKLQQKGKPDSPQNVRALSSSFDYFTLTWDEGFDGGYPDTTTFRVQYQKSSNSRPKYIDCGVSNPCNITNLDQTSEYFVRVLASNEAGTSKFSAEESVFTKVDINMIPKPHNVHYEKSTKRASFHIDEFEITGSSLIAKIELESSQDPGSWIHYDALVLEDGESFGELPVDSRLPMSNLRVSLCLRSNELKCGPPAEALFVDVRPNAATGKATGFGQPWLIGVVISVIVLASAALIVSVRCFCCSSSKAKKAAANAKANNVNGGSIDRPAIIHPPPYTSFNGIDKTKVVNNSSPSTVKDISDDDIKTNLYSVYQTGNDLNNSNLLHTNNHIHLTHLPYQNIPPTSDATASAGGGNGGSVNSQDSLWNNKTNNGILITSNDYQQQQQAYTTFDYHPNNGYHHQNQHQNSYTVMDTSNGEYAHYPYPDEYMTNRSATSNNGQFNNVSITNQGEQTPHQQYSMPNKQQHRHSRIESEYSHFGDVSGNPNPYHMDYHHHGQQPQQHFQQQQHNQQQNQVQAGNPEDSVNESGYSTPTNRNRRIIREIIV